jgi:hypothetical protein
VEWEDSYGCSSSWQDIVPNAEPRGMICWTLGWLVRRSEKFLLLVPHIAKNDDLHIEQGCGDMAIPLAAIIRCERIGKFNRAFPHN